MADKKEACKSCSSNTEGGCSASSCETPEKSLFGSLNDIKNVVAIMSGKGGVGKSTVTCLLAVNLARMGYRVGVLDADITGPSIPKAFGIEGGRLKATDFGILPPQTDRGIKIMSVNLFLPGEDEPVIWRGPMLGGLIHQFWGESDWREIDYLLVDLPPGTGDVPLTVMQSLPVSGIVIVSSPQELVQMVVKKAIKMAQKMNVEILGLVENMSYAVCPHCSQTLNLFGESKADKIAAQTGLKVLAQMPLEPAINQLMDQGKVEEAQSDAAKQLSEAVIAALPVAR
ncbi:MAG: Mrp/NBP35 family ATP-binding protein [Solirubrobacterales bacterium]